MYRLVYLPIARQDMAGIARYIGHDLHSPAVAGRLAEKMVESAERLTEFPYAHPVYRSARPLNHEYRRMMVQNYLMFYYVEEQPRLITVARILYARRDYESLL